MTLHIPLHSLKWRFALAAGGATLVLIAAVVGLQVRLVRAELRDRIAAQQATSTLHAARDLDARLAANLSALAKTAAHLPVATITDETAFRDMVESQQALLVLFDDIVLVAPDGVIVSDFPRKPGRVGLDSSDRSYYQQVLKTKKPVISEPTRSKLDASPFVFMAAPVLDAQGSIRAIVAGVLRLQRPNVLGNVSSAKFGETGYHFVLTALPDPVYVVHPDKSRILEHRPANATKSTTRALDGFQGTVEDVDSAGMRALISYARVESTGWVLASVLPVTEAFAPLESAKRWAIVVALGAALVVAPLVWLLAWRLLAPLATLSTAIRAMRRGKRLQRVDVGGRDEIGQLATAFNDLIDKLQVAEADLRDSEQRIRSIADNLPALVCYIDPDRTFRFNNHAYERWLQVPLAQITGRQVADVYGSTVYERLRPHLDRAMAGERTKFEVDFEGRDGATHVARGRYVPHRDEDGRVIGVFGLITDETKLKRAELSVLDSEKRLLDITNNIPAVIGQFDMQERCVFANDIGLKVHGLTRDDLPELTFGSHIDPALYAMHEPALREVLAGKPSVVHGERDLDGRKVWFKAHLVPDFGPTGDQRGFYIVTFDITTIKAAERAEARSRQRLRDITDHLPVLISHLDADARVTYVNEMFKSCVGLPADGMIGASAAEMLGPQLYAQRAEHIRRCLAGELITCEISSPVHGELRHFRATYVPERLPDGGVIGMTTLSVDITALKNAERRLSQLAHCDALTGLPNRLAFNQQLEESFVAQAVGRMAVMFLDVDRFKQINDTHGHAVGDAVLREFAKRVQGSVRTTDFCARLAGDEFVVVLHDLDDRRQAREIARKILRQLFEPFQVNGLTLHVSASVGVAFREQGLQSAADLLARADSALYEAKSAGRNTYRLAA